MNSLPNLKTLSSLPTVRWHTLLRRAKCTFKLYIIVFFIYIFRILAVSSLMGCRHNLVVYNNNNNNNNNNSNKQESLAIAKTTARCAQYTGALKSFESPRKRPRLLFPKFVILFRSILRMCIQSSKFIALSIPEIIGGTQKIWAVPRYAHAPFSLKFLKGFCSDGPCEHTCQV